MELMHYGKGHDDNPPGRGSGRYAWGSTKADTKIHEKNKKKLLKNKDYIEYTTNADYRKDALVKKTQKYHD
jgi:hypothetical protein